MEHKKNRQASLMIRHITDIIQFSLRNPNIGFITVTEGKVNHDQTLAKIYVTFFDDATSAARLEELNKSKGFIRSELAKRMDIYKVPEIAFLLDETYQKARHLEETLRKEAEMLKKK
jgi:ribosome-binding factor A